MSIKISKRCITWIDNNINLNIKSHSAHYRINASNLPFFNEYISHRYISDTQNYSTSYYISNELTKLGMIVTKEEKGDLKVKKEKNIIGTDKFIKNNKLPTNLYDNLIIVENALMLKSVRLEYPFRFIEAYQDIILTSPIILNPTDLDFFINAILRNRPVENFFYVKKKQLSYITENKFTPQILHYASSLKPSITSELNLKFQNTEEYSFSFKTTKIKNKIIRLKNKPVNYHQDGGSRSRSPEDTLKILLNYVSEAHGYISKPIKIGSVGQSIQVFRSGFFKLADSKSLHNNDLHQTALGKGVESYQSKVSALCEAIERKNAQYDNDPICIRATVAEMKSRYVTFHQLVKYSSIQYTLFADKQHTESNRKQAVVDYDNTIINWQTCWSITNNEPVYVPTVLCYANTPFEDDKFGRWQSNGCAAGNNLEEAILQALFELIERDATAIWWYNKLERPSFDLNRLNPDYFELLHQSIDKEHDYWVLDLTIDTGVPVMAAIGRHKVSKGFIFGFGCHLKPEMAAQRALTELCQLIPIRNQNGAPFDFDAIEVESYLFANEKYSRGHYTLNQSLDIKKDILAIVEKLKTMELETLVLDYTRPHIPIHTAKVFVPGLCHIWPQLGNQRLYDTPVKLGWLDEPLNEQTINQQGLYI